MGICAGERDKYNAYLNTALTTTLNWDSKILTAEADLVTAHELGHNWGAGKVQILFFQIFYTVFFKRYFYYYLKE